MARYCKKQGQVLSDMHQCDVCPPPKPIESAGLRGAAQEVLQSKEWKRLQKLLDEVSWGYQ